MAGSPVRILELRSVWGTGGGPDKTILKGAAQSDPSRYAVTVCYIRDARDPAFGITARARALAIDYTEVIERHSFDLGVWPQLRRLVRERGIQVVHSHDYKTDLLALALSTMERVAALSTAHGWSGETRKDRLYYDVNKRTLRRFRRVIAVSERIRSELLRYGARPERVVVIPNGIDTDEFRRDPAVASAMRQRLGVAEGDVVIGAVGRLETVKCYDLLIDAFDEVKRHVPRARLLIAGEGPCRPALEAQIAAKGLATACTLLGQRSDVRDVYQAFDVFVQSSRSEGSPNAVLEAMALEVPVVATDVGGTADLAQNGIHALLVQYGDRAAMAEAIVTSLVEAGGRIQRVEAARERVERYLSFRARNQAVEEQYDLICGRSCDDNAPEERPRGKCP